MFKTYTKKIELTRGRLKKWGLILRLTVLLVAVMLQVSASSLAQTLSFSKQNATYKEVFDQIHRQLGYDVVWPSRKFNAARSVDVDLRNAALEKVLKTVLDPREVSYTIRKKMVLISVKEKSLVNKVVEAFSVMEVKGKVVDEKGMGLAGASVKVKEGSASAVTGAEGDFVVRGVPDNAVLVFSFIGYSVRELPAKSDMGVVRLEPATSDLKEVVINKGYYTTSRELNTGSVSRVEAKDIEKQPVTNPLAAIAGRMPGVNIQQTSGIPGSDFRIEIRGRNSLRSDGNSPLYIVDGIPFSSDRLSSRDVAQATGSGISPLTSINPSDIESIEVLKDADATAIYGSRGANGVVLITTKKGKAGVTKFDLMVYNGAGTVPRVKTLSREQYLEMRREAFANDGITLYPATAYDMNGGWDNTRYTDWQKVLSGNTAHSLSTQGSLSGGSENTQFLASVGYRRETSVFPGDLAYQKGSAHLSLNHTSTDKKFSINVKVSGTLDKNNQVDQDYTGKAFVLSPVAPPIYKEDGSLNWQNNTWQNPFASLINNDYDGNTSNILANAVLAYKVLKNLNFSASFGLNSLSTKEQQTIRSTSFSPVANFTSADSFVLFGSGSIRSWIIEPQLTWNPKLGSGQFSVLMGATLQEQQLDRVFTSYKGFSNNLLIGNLALASTITPRDFVNSLYHYGAVFGRINYTFQEKYIANLTFRRDGSSRFGPGKQFASFGAFGLAYLFHKEDGMAEKLPWLSFGKIRGSYGITGSDQIGDYQFYDTYSASSNQYQGIKGLAPSRLFNSDFAWETNRKLEVAMELGFLKDRLMLNLAWYRNRSSNQLVNYTLPLTTGFSGILANFPATVQNTGFEAELTTVNLKRKLRWTTSFNLTVPRNKLVEFPGIESSSYANTYVIGEPLYITKRYESTGVDPQTGLYTFRDFNGDGLISDPADKQKVMFVGQNFYGGVNNGLSYKNFTLEFLFQYVKQGGYSARYQDGTYGAALNFPAFVMGESRWQRPGDKATLQRFATESNRAVSSANLLFTQHSDGAFGDASFIRLKNISLTYKLPDKWTKGSLCNFYLQGQNLFVLTKYKGFDPETQTKVLPPIKMLTAGIQLTFK